MASNYVSLYYHLFRKGWPRQKKERGGVDDMASNKYVEGGGE